MAGGLVISRENVNTFSASVTRKHYNWTLKNVHDRKRVKVLCCSVTSLGDEAFPPTISKIQCVSLPSAASPASLTSSLWLDFLLLEVWSRLYACMRLSAKYRRPNCSVSRDSMTLMGRAYRWPCCSVSWDSITLTGGAGDIDGPAGVSVETASPLRVGQGI